MLDIRPANAEDVANILILIKPYLDRAECTGGHSEFASINVETRIPGLRCCWHMHGCYMSFRPDGFPYGHIEFRATIIRRESDHPEHVRSPDVSYVVSPEMLDFYAQVRQHRGQLGKNRVAAFFPELQGDRSALSIKEEFETLEYQAPHKPKRKWYVALLVALGLSSGCSLLPPSTECTGSIAFSERSHLLEGWPFGPRTEEDALTEVQLPVRCERGRTWAQADLGYNIKGRNGGGFHGSAFTGGFSFGHKLWTYRSAPSRSFPDTESDRERSAR